MRFVFHCHNCYVKITLEPSPSAIKWLREGNTIVLDCDCGQSYAVNTQGVKNITDEEQIKAFAERLESCDIVAEVMKNGHDTSS